MKDRGDLDCIANNKKDIMKDVKIYD